MTLKDLLNADVALIGQWLQQGFAWWTGQLGSLAPTLFRPRQADTTEATQTPAADGYRLTRNGELGARLDAPLAKPRKVVLRLAPGQALVREIELPTLSRDDTARLVALDLDRLMPFPSGTAVHAMAVVQRDPLRNRQTVRLAAASRTQTLSALHHARSFGLEPVALLAADSDLDLLPALSSGSELSLRRLYWGITVAALIGVNVFLLIYRDMDQTARLRSLVEEQRPAASAGLRLQRTAAAEDIARRSLLDTRKASSPMRLLSTLTEVMPAGAWVHRLAWNGKAVRLTGYRSPSVDVLTALRADPRFSEAKGSLEGPQPTAQPGGNRPFDVSAAVRSAP